MPTQRLAHGAKTALRGVWTGVVVVRGWVRRCGGGLAVVLCEQELEFALRWAQTLR